VFWQTRLFWGFEGEERVGKGGVYIPLKFETHTTSVAHCSFSSTPEGLRTSMASLLLVINTGGTARERTTCHRGCCILGKQRRDIASAALETLLENMMVVVGYKREMIAGEEKVVYILKAGVRTT
jgi:hypothetical protein